MTVAFIPSKGRPELADRCVTSILKHGKARPIVVIEPSQQEAYRGFFDLDGNYRSAMLSVLSEDGRGIGYARAQIVRLAAANDEQTILMVDDDARATSPYADLVDSARADSVVGVGAWASIYGLYLGRDVRLAAQEERGLILGTNGMGGQFMALNVANVLKVGNFPEWADVSLEDHELIRQTIWHGYRWYVHPDSQYSCGTRWQPGGLATFHDREERARDCWWKSHKIWPDYVSDPETKQKYRCSWKKLIAASQARLGRVS